MIVMIVKHIAQEDILCQTNWAEKKINVKDTETDDITAKIIKIMSNIRIDAMHKGPCTFRK